MAFRFIAVSRGYFCIISFFFPYLYLARSAWLSMRLSYLINSRAKMRFVDSIRRFLMNRQPGRLGNRMIDDGDLEGCIPGLIDRGNTFLLFCLPYLLYCVFHGWLGALGVEVARLGNVPSCRFFTSLFSAQRSQSSLLFSLL